MGKMYKIYFLDVSSITLRSYYAHAVNAYFWWLQCLEIFYFYIKELYFLSSQTNKAEKETAEINVFSTSSTT